MYNIQQCSFEFQDKLDSDVYRALVLPLLKTIAIFSCALDCLSQLYARWILPSLRPQIEELKNVRKEYMEVNAEYEQKKIVYDKVKYSGRLSLIAFLFLLRGTI